MDLSTGALESLAAGAYLRVVSLLGADVRTSASVGGAESPRDRAVRVAHPWVADQDGLVPDPEVRAAEVRRLCLLLVAWSRLGDASAAPLRDLLAGPFWDWQSLRDQTLIELALNLTTPRELTPWQFQDLRDDPYGQVLLFEVALSALEQQHLEQASGLFEVLSGECSVVIGALLNLRMDQSLSPATEATLLTYAQHPGVTRVRSGGQRQVRLNLLSGQLFDAGTLLEVGGKNMPSARLVLPLILLLSEGEPTGEDMSAALGLPGKPGMVVSAVRQVLSAGAVITDARKPVVYRLDRGIQVSSDLADLEQRARFAPLATLRDLAGKLEVGEQRYVPLVLDRVMRVIDVACAHLSPVEVPGGLEVLHQLSGTSADLRLVMRWQDRLRSAQRA